MSVKRGGKQLASSSPTFKHDLVTIKEAAEFLRVTGRTLRSWLRAGRIPRVKMGHIVRIRKQDLKAFIEHSVQRRA
jgi:excisionase family DNA binding protein